MKSKVDNNRDGTCRKNKVEEEELIKGKTVEHWTSETRQQNTWSEMLQGIKKTRNCLQYTEYMMFHLFWRYKNKLFYLWEAINAHSFVKKGVRDAFLKQI